ncbi:LamG domain-containing protein [Pedobacter foliorum]|uniref:LamG domain-containing protein n=1 Tax=Pedobacter foliorum TaxID=2739058 RepID=UPI0015667837|nr:LamG domain-containing protein [Pedobacter foliorum]NRF41594.1 LamG domain-containing protein [Pedobacter foliorum]
MKNTKISASALWCLALAISFSLVQCTKAEKDDDFTPGDPPPVEGGFVNSSEIEPASLVAYFPFEDNVDDKQATVTGGAIKGSGTFTEGRKGKAYQGANGAFISYANPGAVGALTSFTVSFWINTQKHDGGAQGVFALSKEDGSFWGNFFVIIEGNNSSSDKMLTKLHFEKNVTPPINNVEQWLDLPEALRPDNMYGAWRQITYTYDETTSKVAYYANGQRITIDENNAGAIVNRTDRKANDTTPLGALAFKNPAKFVIGGYQNQLGAPYGGAEPWMLTYTGKLDEMRIYKKALTPQQVSALFKLESQGR